MRQKTRAIGNSRVDVVTSCYAAIFLKFAATPGRWPCSLQMSQAVTGLVAQPVSD